MTRWLLWAAISFTLTHFIQAQDSRAAAAEDRSTFIVTGTVTSIQNSSPSQKVLALDVENTRKSPKALGDLNGQQIRILSKPDTSIKEGGKYTFYAVGDSAGDALTLRELKHSTGTANVRPVSMPMSVARRYAGSDVIVQGKILNIIPVPSASTPEPGKPVGPPSEHRSKPQVVQLQVTKLLKGELHKTLVPIVVETSEDIAHVSGESRESETLQIGKTGVFALRWNPDQKAWTASKATDIQPSFELGPIMDSVAAVQKTSKAASAAEKKAQNPK